MNDCPAWCCCQCVMYTGDSPDRCPEAFDDDRGVARCYLGRGHHGEHKMSFSEVRVSSWQRSASVRVEDTGADR